MVVLTNDDELDRHEEPKEIEEDLEGWPALCLPETIRPREEDKGIPCCDGEGADQKVFVGAQMGGEVELVGELEARHGGEREGRGEGKRFQAIPCYISNHPIT